MKSFKIDAYDGMSFFGGLVFFAPVALLVRTRAGIGDGQFFLLQVLLSAVVAVGELPTGYLTDRIGYRNSLLLSQLLLLLARGLLLAAYLLRSLPLFVARAFRPAFPPGRTVRISMHGAGRPTTSPRPRTRQISGRRASCSARRATPRSIARST